MNIYCYYSFSGYKLLLLNDSGSYEVTTENYREYPQEVYHYISSQGLKLVYKLLPNERLMICVQDLPSNDLDNAGKSRLFTMQLIGDRTEKELFDKLAIVIADNLIDFGHFCADLFTLDTEVKFDYSTFAVFLEKLIEYTPVYPNLQKHPLYKVAKGKKYLLVYEGKTIESSIKNFDYEFDKTSLRNYIQLAQTDLIKQSGKIYPLSKILTGTTEKQAKEPYNETKKDSDKEKEELSSINILKKKLEKSEEEVKATNIILNLKEKEIRKIKLRCYYIAGTAILAGIAIGYCLK